MTLATLLKQPAEVLIPLLPFAAPVAAIGAVGVVARGLVPGAAALDATALIAGGAVNVRLAGGADGERYLVTVAVTCTDGQQLEGELDVAVVETTWAMPDGGAPWLSIADFIRQVGYPETLAATDPDGSGAIDRDLLTRALTAAQATAESFIAARYALPLAVVPPLLAVAVADLALARLYPRGAPDGVKANAAAATALLGRLQSGAASLPIAGLEPPAASDAPVVSVAGRRAYRDDLRGYADDPRWGR